MHTYVEFFAVFQNFKIFMYSTIVRGNPIDVLRVDVIVDEVNMEHWWNDTDGKTELLGENAYPRVAVSTTHLTWGGRPVTMRCVVDKLAVRGSPCRLEGPIFQETVGYSEMKVGAYSAEASNEKFHSPGQKNKRC